MKNNSLRIQTGDKVLSNGTMRTEADYERMALEVETTLPDMERLLDRQRRGVGRPALGDGESPILNVRLDAATRAQLAELAEHDHTTPSAVVRDAIKTYLQNRLKAS